MFYWQSEPCHEFHNNLVLLRRLNYCTLAIEIFLEVDTYVGNEGSGKTEGQIVWFVYKQWRLQMAFTMPLAASNCYWNRKYPILPNGFITVIGTFVAVITHSGLYSCSRPGQQLLWLNFINLHLRLNIIFLHVSMFYLIITFLLFLM